MFPHKVIIAILLGALLLDGCALLPESIDGQRAVWAVPAADPILEPAPVAQAVAKRLAAVSATNITNTAYVVLDNEGNLLASKDDIPMIPASNTKVFTAMAAIAALGVTKTFDTKVVSAKRGKITLVGGGDPLLTVNKGKVSPGNLASLATLTAKSLKKSKVKKVALSYDSGAFTGVAYAPSWKASWKSYTPGITALLVNGGKSKGGSAADANPALAAAKAFASKLKAQGIKVSSVKSQRAPAKAKLIAKTTSAKLGAIVQGMLRNSENVTAEVLARHTAKAMGLAPSFSGASMAITRWAKANNLWVAGMKIDGGCGLSSDSKISPGALALAIHTARNNPRYRDVLSGLAIAGVNGTLRTRFNNDALEGAGRKVVHAKTGSLNQVHVLTGYVDTKTDKTFTFSFMTWHANNYNAKAAAINWLDRSATALATCGCSVMPEATPTPSPTVSPSFTPTPSPSPSLAQR